LQFSESCGIIFKQSGATLWQAKRIVGVDYDGGPPVPIPNTEVKPARAENTWLETAREDRFSPTLKDGFFIEAVFFCFKCCSQSLLRRKEAAIKLCSLGRSRPDISLYSAEAYIQIHGQMQRENTIY
jgi:hypothetical protein